MKVDKEVDRKVTGESQSFERCASGVERSVASTSMGTSAKSGFDELPREMHQMKILDDKADNQDDKVKFHC